LRTPIKYAEQIKIKYASALPNSVDPDEMIQVPSMAKHPPKEISARALAQVVGARYEELFALVLAELRRSGFEDLITAGIVASVIIGGIKRIANVASKLVPLMCLFYITSGLIILFKNNCSRYIKISIFPYS